MVAIAAIHKVNYSDGVQVVIEDFIIYVPDSFTNEQIQTIVGQGQEWVRQQAFTY